MQSSIYVGMGANLAHERYGTPQQTLEAALQELARRQVQTVHLSPWYKTAPLPPSDQPWFVNAVAEVVCALSADALLAELHRVEAEFGRRRTVPNAARPIDLDLLDYRGQIAIGGDGRASLPHPRLAERAFVLCPLADLAPAWRHPVTGRSIRDLLRALPADQEIVRITS